MPRKAASVSWLIRSRRKLRRTRGLSWLVERVKATIVTEKAMPATETVTVAIVSSMLRAASWVAKSNSGTCAPSQASTSGRPSPATRPSPIASAESEPKEARKVSKSAARRSREVGGQFSRSAMTQPPLPPIPSPYATGRAGQ